MDIVEYLTTCEFCNNEFNHYDYLAHREICHLTFTGFDRGYDADTENDNISISYKLNYPSRISPLPQQQLFTNQNNKDRL